MHCKVPLVVFVLYFCLHLGSASFVKDVNSSRTAVVENDVVRRWELFEGRVKEIANYLVKLLLPKLMEAQNSFNLSRQCTTQTMMVIGGLKKIKPWAMRLVDASGKMFDGILTGTMSMFGAYDQCLTTVVKNERRNKNDVLFRGKYCYVDVKPPLPPKPDFYKLNEVLPELKEFSERGTAMSEAAKFAHFFYFISIRVGLCVPSGCTREDIQQLADAVGEYMYVNATVARCEMQKEKEYNNSVIAIITASSFMGLLMLIGTLIDLYIYYTGRTFNNILVRILLCFSFITNFKKFANTETSSDTLSCLNGIRFLCMSWVVLGHSYLILNYQIFRGLETVRDFAKDFAFQAIVNGSVAVDTFFCIGGLLVCYVTVKIVKDMGKKFNVPLFIFHRLWRVLPVYAFVIGFMFLNPILGDGPIWHDTTHEFMRSCEKNWWANLLFINNFYDPEHMCIPQSWYLASDMQLYLASLLVLLPLLKWPKVGLSIAGVGILASMVFSGVGTYINNYPPAMLFAHPDPVQRNEYWAHFYFKPYVHAGAYCIGMITGYILATRPKLHIPRSALVAGWCLAIICNMSVLYGVWEWNKGRDPTFWEGMLYASCNRTAWAFGVCWMILCCATGYGGVINYILSWKLFIPLGRLTFIVYLIHPLVQATAVGNVRAQIQPAHYFMVWVYFGHMFITYATAFAGTMLIEGPFLAMEKLILPRGESGKKKPLENNELNGGLKMSKDGDLATVVPVKQEEAKEGLENGGFVCKL